MEVEMKTLFDEEEPKKWVSWSEAAQAYMNQYRIPAPWIAWPQNAQERFRSALQEDTRRQAIRHTTEESPGVQVPG
jgi:hypothetical protein